MKKVCLLIAIVFITISCSNESPKNESIEEDLLSTRTKIILPNEEILFLDYRNNKFIENDDYIFFIDFIENNKNLILADFKDHQIRIFSDRYEAKKYLKGVNGNFSGDENNKNRNAQIFGEVALFDGINNTGQQVLIKMSYGNGNKVTYQFPMLDRLRTQYNSDGTAIGPVINMNDKISSIKIRNYGLVTLYNDEWFKGSVFLFANVPDLSGQPYQRSINLPSHPFSVVLNKNNVHSSLSTTVDVD